MSNAFWLASSFVRTKIMPMIDAKIPNAAINIGSSGGPLLDRHGKVIGLISSVLGEYRSFPTSGISYAVSAETIRTDFLGLEPQR